MLNRPLHKFAIIGCGNISNTRHIPALKKCADRAEITALVSTSDTALTGTAAKVGPVHKMLVDPDKDLQRQFKGQPWLEEIDACVIGTPPRSHKSLAETMMLLGKDVLIEKPFAMSIDEADLLLEVEKRTGRTIAVMHNFQYSSGIRRLRELIAHQRFGPVRSFSLFQLTNRYRRLPVWYDELPLGLFYDEAAHFFYLLMLLGGPVSIDAVNASKSSDSSNTPGTITAVLKAGACPATLYINTESPVCEWLFAVCFERQYVVYDFFRDILLRLPSDNQHLAKDIFRTSIFSTVQHWAGFLKSGIKLVSGNLLYGQLEVFQRFLDCIDTRQSCDEISGVRGRETVRAMTDIVSKLTAASPETMRNPVHL